MELGDLNAARPAQCPHGSVRVMRLEDQGLDAEQMQEALADRVAELVNDRRLWRGDRDQFRRT